MFGHALLAFFQDTSWTHMFTLDQTAFWAEKFLRPIIIYIVLIVLLRLFGKRELAQLNPFDLVLILILSNTVQNGIIGQDNSLIGAVAGAVALLAINWVMAQLKFRIPMLERATEGVPVTVIKKGKTDEKARRQELLTDRDFEIIAHKTGLDDARDIEKLVIDPNGGVLVDGKDEVKDAKFKRDVIHKIDRLTEQIIQLQQNLKSA